MSVAESTRPAKLSFAPHVAVVLVLLACLAVYFKVRDATEPIGARTPVRFVLPAGFTGAVKVIYEVQGAPELPVVDGYRVVDIDPASALVVESVPGVFHMELRTSSPAEYGSARDIIERRTLDGGIERLSMQWVRDRKVGVEGDRKDFVNDAREVEARLAILAEEGRLAADGTVAGARPYEMLVLRDNL